MNGIFYGFPSRYGLREPLDVKEFTVSGTYIAPRGARKLVFILVGAGSGGGSGRRSALPTVELSQGGGGGFGGGWARYDLWIKDFGEGTQFNIAIGAGGAGGASRNSGIGSAGFPGGAGGKTVITIPGRPGFRLEAGGGPASGNGTVGGVSNYSNFINASKFFYNGLPNADESQPLNKGADKPGGPSTFTVTTRANHPGDVFYRSGTNNCGAGGGGCSGGTEAQRFINRGGHVLNAYGDTIVDGTLNDPWIRQQWHNPLSWEYTDLGNTGSTANGGTADLVMLYGGSIDSKTMNGGSFSTTGTGPEITAPVELNPVGAFGNFIGIGGAGGGGGWSASSAGDGGDGWRGGGGGGGGGIANAVGTARTGAGGAGGNGYVLVIAE